MSSPTARTLQHLKKLGYLAGVVERRVKRTICIDLFGCIDIVAVKPGHVLGIQATSGSNHAARRTKSSQEPRLAAWLASGATFEVWSWARRGERGKRKAWTLRREAVGLENLVGAEVSQERGRTPIISGVCDSESLCC